AEETAQLRERLLKIAEVYDDEVDNAVEGITSLLEPIMIVILALIVGTIVIALFMPLIEIIKGMQTQQAPQLTAIMKQLLPLRRDRGFTLIEMLTVMLIIAILASLILGVNALVQN